MGRVDMLPVGDDQHQGATGNRLLPPALTNPSLPKVNSKSIFAFWHSGIEELPPYLLRNVLAWYHRFSPLGWTVYVLDTVPGSALNVSKFIDLDDPGVAPAVLKKGGIGGQFAGQHTSDLTRYPLLLKYGGVYLDVGIVQFGDLNRLWSEHIANRDSPYDFSGFTLGPIPDGLSIVNFGFMCTSNNPLVLRAHKILLKLWEGKTNTAGMHAHPLVQHVPLMAVPEEVVTAGDQVSSPINDGTMTDYAIQIQAMGSAQRWLDTEDGWDGPQYVRDHCWLYDMLEMTYVSEQLTGWNGRRAHELLSLNLPAEGEEENADQALARTIVEKSVKESWCLKLMHGFSAKIFGGDTLGMLWRKNVGSDAKEGTYAAYMRSLAADYTQIELLKPLCIAPFDATKVDSLDKYLLE